MLSRNITVSLPSNDIEEHSNLLGRWWASRSKQGISNVCRLI